jgi:hypothetical protein
MAKKPHIQRTAPRASSVVVSRLPTVRCSTCNEAIARPPGKKANEVLTEHWAKKHAS